MRKRFVIVSGPESSGNRLVAAYLERAGVECTGSTEQVAPDRLAASKSADVALIVHHEPKLSRTVAAAGRHGRDVLVVIVTREMGATVDSMVSRRHVRTNRDARERIAGSLKAAVACCAAGDFAFVVVSYESLILHPFATVRNMLEYLDLPADNLDGDIRVQHRDVRPIPVDRNAPHYGDFAGRREKTDPPELIWYPARGEGFYPVADPVAAYDDKYFAKYVGYAATDQGRSLTAARVELVERHAPGLDVLDFGAGAGQFVEAMDERARGGCAGYDINPRAVEWLCERGAFVDPYAAAPDVLTAWDSLEHVRDPDPLISRVRRFVFVSTPIYASGDDVLSSHHYRPDEHFWYWSDWGLRARFRRLGFECLESSRMEESHGRQGIGTYVFRRCDL